VLLNTALKGSKINYNANSIIEVRQLIEKGFFSIKEDILAV
jgi:hypothetical protein